MVGETSVRPFRFGLLVEGVVGLPALRETARRAEAAGFSTLLFRDHLVAAPFGAQLAPLTALATVAACTSTLRVGTMVLANDFRHPAVLAKEAATLDLLSGGRLELGLGAGFLEEEYRRAGLAFPPPGTRVERLTEALAVLRGLWSDRAFSFAGAHYRIDSLDGQPKPFQRPGPPLLVAAAGPRMLRLAGRAADIVGLQSVSTAAGAVADDPRGRLASTLDERVALVREAAGTRFAALELSTTVSLVVTDRPGQAAGSLIAARGWGGVNADDVLAMPSLAFGSVDGLVEALLGRRARHGLSYYVVSDRSLESAAPVVARLAGR